MSRGSTIHTVLIMTLVCVVDLVIVSAACIATLMLALQEPTLLIPAMAMLPVVVWASAWFSVKASSALLELATEDEALAATREGAPKPQKARASVTAYGGASI